MATGKIGKMQNKNINVATPFAALAVRGTDFWWGRIEGQYGALLVSNSRLDVRNDGVHKGTKLEEDHRGADAPSRSIELAMELTSRTVAARVPPTSGLREGGSCALFDYLWLGVIGNGIGAGGSSCSRCSRSGSGIGSRLK